MRFRLPFLGRPSPKPASPSTGEPVEPPTPLEVVRAYHLATRHHEHAFARGPGYLDWDTQPDPFRRYAGARLIELDHEGVDGEGVRYPLGFVEGGREPAAVDRRAVSQLFRDALGLTAWKEFGEARWALRANPSSGNLHPTEGYFVGGPVEGLCETPIVAHYAPREHALELRAELGAGVMEELRTGGASFFVGLTSIHWREAWKYGERAYRYCQHDAGHAIAAFAIAAAGLGWNVRLVDHLGHDELVRLLGLDRPGGGDAEPEEPDVLLAVFAGPVVAAEPVRSIPEALDTVAFAGTPNELSPEHAEWEAVEYAGEASRKPSTPLQTFVPTHVSAPDASLGEELSLRAILHQRRSAVAFDRKTSISLDDFCAMLAHTLPAPGRVPFSALPWPARVHLGLFVHRVTGLEPGLYVLVRDAERTPLLRAAMERPFDWQRPDGVPETLELYRLSAGNVQPVARGVSCTQDIASDGAFAVAMLTEYRSVLATEGAWAYPRLHWEAGAVGQVLYLDAEAAGVRATGIGCFFDEPTQRVFGLGSDAFRTLYHFTVGGPVDDGRLQTWPAYPPRDRKAATEEEPKSD